MTVHFGEKIKQLRAEKGITQDTLAKFLGVTFQTISKWEREETYPDITMLPAVAAFFNTTTDDLLGIDTLKKEEQIQEYLSIYENMRFKDSPYTFGKLSEAIKEFPGDYRLLVRYMERLIAEKTFKHNPDYEKVSQELVSIYENIQSHCTDDNIRMWSKRLISQHLHSKAFLTGIDVYQEQCEEILQGMPNLIDSKEYVSTMLISDHEKHRLACSKAIEKELYILDNTVAHYCNRQDSLPFRIEALNKIISVLDIFYTDGNYGHLWLNQIYNYGNLGRFYCENGDNENALKALKQSAEYARKYDSLPPVTERYSQFFENTAYEKTVRGKTMCERMKIFMTEKYNLPDSFIQTAEFKEIINILNG